MITALPGLIVHGRMLALSSHTPGLILLVTPGSFRGSSLLCCASRRLGGGVWSWHWGYRRRRLLLLLLLDGYCRAKPRAPEVTPRAKTLVEGFAQRLVYLKSKLASPAAQNSHQESQASCQVGKRSRGRHGRKNFACDTPCDLFPRLLLTWARLANPSDAPCGSIRMLCVAQFTLVLRMKPPFANVRNATVPRRSEAHHSSKSVQTIPTIDLGGYEASV